MNKSEFLTVMREQLEGEVPSAELYSSIRYYDEYIDREVASGQSEENVLDSLGDPRLLAKTIIDADEASARGNSYSEDSSYTYSDTSDYHSNEESGYEDEQPNSPKVHRLDLTTWYGKALIVLVAAGIIFLLITLLSALLPVIIIVVLVSVIITLIRRHK